MTTHDRSTRSGRRYAKLVASFAAFALVAAACGGDDDDAETQDTSATQATAAEETAAEETAAEETAAEETAAEETAAEETAAEETAAEETAAGGAGASFVSTQFVPVEEAAKFQAILDPAGISFTGSEDGPMIDQILAGAGATDVVGTLHGNFPPLAAEDAMANMADVLDDLSADREFAASFVEAGLLGTDDFLYYVPWAQATYIMAANTQSLEYLPEGADINALTWEQYGDWCQAMLDGEGKQLCGLPHAGLFHRFLEGYMWPSFTGGMVSEFRSAEAEGMLTWARDSLWPTVNPESINYEFMQEPLQAGEVWVAFDHVARLIDAFSADAEGFVAFPSPAGAAGRGFMPVIVGLGIPADAANPDEGAAVIEYLTRPEVQAEVLAELAFFPVVDGVDFSGLPEAVQIEAEAVNTLANSPDAIAALLPVGLGERGGEINEIFRAAFDRVVLNGEDIPTVLNEEGDKLQTLLNETGAPCWSPDPPSDGPCVVNPAG